MPTEKITNLGKILSSWTSILLLVGGIIAWGFGTFYTINSNSSEIENLKLIIRDNNTLVEREFEIYEQRSNKRYKRSEKEDEKLYEYIRRIEDEQIEIIKELYYLKGKTEK